MLYFFCFDGAWKIKDRKYRGDKMPRMAREKSSTKVYHIILRGNAKQDIFLAKQDYSKFIKEICNTKEKYQYELYVYCLMTNHVHLILYDKNEQLSKALQSLAISYSSYWNRKYERTGHLFQNRFLSKRVETIEYLKNLSRYIHQNPYKAGIAKMEEYEWSSYQEYIKEEKIINGKQILEIFNKNKREFIEYHEANIQKDNLEDFMEYEMIDKLNDEQAMKYIKTMLGVENIQELINYNVKKRNEYLRKLKKIKGISNAQIARIIGISAKMVERARK